MIGWLAVTAGAGVPSTPGRHEIAVGTHLVTLVVPAVPENGPVIVGLHFAGHGAPHYATGYLEAVLGPAAPANAILLAPDCPSSSWTTKEAEGVVLDLIDRVVGDLHADPRRVVLTGYSMGGDGAWWLASRHPERFAGVVPMAARPAGDVSVPLVAIHGARDELRPVDDVRTAVAALAASGRDARLRELDRVTHFDTTAGVAVLREELARLAAAR